MESVVSISLPKPSQDRSQPQGSSPAAIQACVASLAAEAFEMGHERAAQLLAQTAALLATANLWNGANKTVK